MKEKQKKYLIQSVVGFVLLALLTLVIVLNFLPKESAKISTITPVFVSKPQVRTIENNYRINGNIETEQMLTILSKISGQLVKLLVDVEDPVKKGQIVAQIDKEPFELQFRQAEAAYLATQSTWNRVAKLYQQGAASLQQYEEVKAKFNATKAQYNLAKLQLSYTDIRSDIDGVVLMRHDNINIGMLVAPTIPIFTIGQPNDLVIKAKIPEQKFPSFDKLRDKIKVRVEIDTYNDVFDAHIDRISPFVEPQSRSFTAYCKFDDQKLSFPPGLSIKLSFVLDERLNVASVSRKALVNDNTLWIAVPKELYDANRSFESLADLKIDYSQSFENTEWVAEKVQFVPQFGDNKFIMIDPRLSDKLIITDGNAYLYSGQPLIVKNLSQEVSVQ